MRETNIVFESPKNWQYWLIKKYIRQGIKVFVIEPFHAYHHEKEIRFYPKALPDYVYKLIRAGQVVLLKADDFDPKDIYLKATDKAVGTCDKIFPFYIKAYTGIVHYVCDILGSQVAENVFRKLLCDKLSVFFSINIMLKRITELLPSKRIIIVSDINIFSYLYLRKILHQAVEEFYTVDNLFFSPLVYILIFIENLKNNLVVIFKLLTQLILSGLWLNWKPKKIHCKEYKYGVTIIGPTRQLANNRRRPDFIVDNNLIFEKDVVYLPLVELNKKQKQQLSAIAGDVFYPPNRKFNNFSHFFKWLGLLSCSLYKWPFMNYDIITCSHLALSEYFRWKKIMVNFKIKNIITHCDFGIQHIPRNIALKQAGVRTWYFTDSMNFSFCFNNKENINLKHPFWAYLYYDNFITWNKAIGEYFCSHPASLNNYNVVGCLWASHASKQRERQPCKFVVSVFDTTYTCNSFTSYKEGIVFAEHILRLTEEIPDIQIFFKEKKGRSLHRRFDSVLSPRLVSLYEKMGMSCNIKIFDDKEDSSEIISNSDMVISFPFTSTTFEALSINKPAIWHDPTGSYTDSLYSTIGVTTHSYSQLKSKILAVMHNGKREFINSIHANSAIMDPYRDGKSIERFKKLLILEI